MHLHCQMLGIKALHNSGDEILCASVVPMITLPSSAAVEQSKAAQ